MRYRVFQVYEPRLYRGPLWCRLAASIRRHGAASRTRNPWMAHSAPNTWANSAQKAAEERSESNVTIYKEYLMKVRRSSVTARGQRLSWFGARHSRRTMKKSGGTKHRQQYGGWRTARLSSRQSRAMTTIQNGGRQCITYEIFLGSRSGAGRPAVFCDSTK